MFDLKKIVISEAFDEPFIMVLRHAQKFIDDKPSTYDCDITQAGIAQSKSFGIFLSRIPFVIHKIKTSPVSRCIQTARILQEKTGRATVEKSFLLGHPGAYIEDEQLAGKVFEEHSVFDIVSQFIAGHHFPGFRNLAEGHRLLLQEMRADLKTQKNSLYVTHDVILGSFLGGVLKLPISKDFWVDYLQGFIVTLSKDNQIVFHLERLV